MSVPNYPFKLFSEEDYEWVRQRDIELCKQIAKQMLKVIRNKTYEQKTREMAKVVFDREMAKIAELEG